jgi:hypothetical protein
MSCAKPKFLDHGQVKPPPTRAESETGSFLLSTTMTCGNWSNGKMMIYGWGECDTRGTRRTLSTGTDTKNASVRLH